MKKTTTHWLSDKRRQTIHCLALSALMVGTTVAKAQVQATSSGASGNYTTLNAAFADINAGTLSGAIVITITGNTTEPATPVPLLSNGNGAANYTSVVISPSGGNFIINSAAAPATNRGIIELAGADNVTIDGDDPATAGSQNLSIVAAPVTTTGVACIRLSSNSTTGADGADNNVIRNCIIKGSRSSATSTVTNYGIQFSNGVTASSSSTGAYSSLNTLIQNNNITRCYHGIRAIGNSATYLNAGTQIIGNTIGSATAADYVANRGISISYSASATGVGSALIKGNDVRTGFTAGTATMFAVEIGAVNAGINITANNIHDCINPTADVWGMHAIEINSATSNTGININNNIIRDIAGFPVSSIGNQYGGIGIYVTEAATGLLINNNTIVQSLSNIVGTCIQIASAGATVAQLQNNILVNSVPNQYSCCLYTTATTNISGGVVNNNDYYITGSGKIGYYSGTSYTTLSNWQTATGKDGASVNENPTFISATNLHIPAGTLSFLESGGANVAATNVANDIDGDDRPGPLGSTFGGATAPDIGADEFDGIKISCYPPSALNSTGVTATSATINWTPANPVPGVGYDIYYSTAATPAPTLSTTPLYSTAGNSQQLSPLQSGTTYYVWVRSDCNGTDKSVWSPLPTLITLPSNDECANAVSLTQNTTCTNTPGSTVGATLSMAAAPCAGNPDDDVWYSFVATATDAKITISGTTAVVGTSTDMYFQVLSGTCGTQTSMMCSDPDNGIVGGLTVGQTYFIRVYTYAAASGNTFNICVTSLSAAPTTCATLSAPAANATVPTTPTLTWSSVTDASAYDIYLDGNNPPTTLYTTVNNNSAVSYTLTTPLATGDYYWYVVPKNSLGAATGCATNARKFTAVLPPPNDNCANAITLTVNQNYTCAASTTGTTIAATQSNETAPTVNAAGTNDDVWYSFTATAATHRIVISNVTGIVTDMAMAIYSGSCGSLTHIQSSDPNTMDVTGLTPGQTYLVRVYTYTSTVGSTASFTICVGSNPPVPANDECTAAVPLTVNADLNCGVTTIGYTYSATQSANTPAPTCGTANGWNDDVWYSFVATGTSHRVTLSNVSGSATDMAMTIYNGTCGSFTQVVCSDPDIADLTGLTPGGTYYVRVYTISATTTNAANFTICVGTPPSTPANDECANAIPLTVNADLNCAVTTNGYTYSTTQSANTPAPTCGVANGWNDDVWYSFVATSANHRIALSNVSGSVTDMVMTVYSGTCGAFTQVTCSDPNTANLTGLTPGNTYYVRVYTYTAGAGAASFTICAGTPPPPPVNDLVCDATTLIVDDPAPSCVNSTNATTSTTDPAIGSCTTADYNVWYKFTPAVSGVHNIVCTVPATTTDGWNAWLFIYTVSGTCPGALTYTLISGMTTGVCYQGPTGTAGSSTTYVTPSALTAGTTYYLFADGNLGDVGEACFRVTSAPLAIALNDISATNSGNRNRVDWKTATEGKGDYFAIERSADGHNFTELGTLVAKGEAATYTYWDETPVNGNNYYRLRVTDASGKFEYSKVVSATVTANGSFTIEAYPNPVSDLVTVKVYGTQGNNPKMLLTDVTGKVLSSLTVNGNMVKVNMSNMPQGIYLIKYTDSNNSQTIKVNKQ